MDATFMPSFGLGPFTATGGTAFSMMVPPKRNRKTRLQTLVYNTSSTDQHTVTLMRPIGWTTLTADAVAGQAVINIIRNPGAYAANAILDGLPVPSVADNLTAASDIVVLELPNGNFLLTTVSSITLLAVTLAANVPTGGVVAGARLWTFGITTDLDPNTGLAHPSLKPLISVTDTFKNDAGGSIFQTKFDYQPIVIKSDNATSAGTIRTVGGIYIK